MTLIHPLTGVFLTYVIYIIPMFYIPNTPQWRVVGVNSDGSKSYWETFDSKHQCDVMCNHRNHDHMNDMTWMAMQLSPSDMLF